MNMVDFSNTPIDISLDYNCYEQKITDKLILYISFSWIALLL